MDKSRLEKHAKPDTRRDQKPLNPQEKRPGMGHPGHGTSLPKDSFGHKPATGSIPGGKGEPWKNK